MPKLWTHKDSNALISENHTIKRYMVNQALLLFLLKPFLKSHLHCLLEPAICSQMLLIIIGLIKKWSRILYSIRNTSLAICHSWLQKTWAISKRMSCHYLINITQLVSLKCFNEVLENYILIKYLNNFNIFCKEIYIPQCLLKLTYHSLFSTFGFEVKGCDNTIP